MKRKGLLLGFITIFSLTIAVFAASNSSKKVQVAEASANETVSGLFYRVEKPSDISVGDDILLISTGGYAPDDFYGNPAYLHASNTGIKLSADGTLATLSDSPAALFKVESGYGGENYALKSSFWIGGIVKTNLYLGIVNKDLYGGPFGYATYFFGQWDRTGVSEEKTNDSDIQYDKGLNANKSNTQWTFAQYDTGKVTIRHVHSNDHGGDLKYTTDYAQRFCRNPRGGSYVQDAFVYKRIPNDPAGYTVTVTNAPTKTSYNHGEKINLSGLQVKLVADEERLYTYIGNEKLFSFPEYAYGDGSTSILVDFVGKVFSVNITVTRENASAILAGERHDYRGTYMIAVLINESSGYALNAKMAKDQGGSSKTLISPVNGKPGRWAVDYSISEEDPNVRFELARNEEAFEAGRNYYSLRNYDSTEDKYSYLCLSDVFGVLDAEDADYTPLEVIYDNYGLRIRNKNNSGGDYLVYDSATNGGIFKFINTSTTGGSIYPVYLYKFDTLDSLTPVQNYVKKFLSDTAVCDMSGQNATITKSIWQGLEKAFNNLSVDSQAILANEEYTHNAEIPGSIGDMVDRYDFIVHKYLHPVDDNEYVISDFIRRVIAGTSQNNVSYNERNQGQSIVQNDLFNNNATLIVITISGFTIVSIMVGYIFIKKKRRDE